MISRFSFLLFVVVLLLLLCAGYMAPALSSEESGCVKCHTDEQILKSLYKPPRVSSSEGEG